MENYRNKLYVYFKSHVVLSSVMKCSASAPSHLGCESSLCPACPFHLSLSSHFGCQVDCHSITVLVFKSPLSYLIMAPELKSSDAGNSDMPKRSCRALPLSENVKVLYLRRKEKHLMLRLLRSMVITNLPPMKL